MSTEERDALSPDEVALLTESCKKIQQKCASGQIDDISDETIAMLLTTATTLYAVATHEGGRATAPFTESAGIAATWVVVTVKAMLQAVSLSSFDLAMWSNRLPTPQFPERS